MVTAMVTTGAAAGAVIIMDGIAAGDIITAGGTVATTEIKLDRGPPPLAASILLMPPNILFRLPGAPAKCRVNSGCAPRRQTGRRS